MVMDTELVIRTLPGRIRDIKRKHTFWHEELDTPNDGGDKAECYDFDIHCLILYLDRLEVNKP